MAKKATKPTKISKLKDTHIYLDAEMLAKLTEEAKQNNRSITGQVRQILQEHYQPTKGE